MTFLKKVAHYFVKNLKTIILSVIFAIIIWFAISIQLFPNVTDHIDDVAIIAEPTQYMKEENLQITDYEPSVTIHIQGKRYIIGSLTAEDFSATLDLSGITTPGTHTVNVILNKVESSNDYEIISSGLTSKVTIERIISEDIAIEVNTDNLSVADELQIQTDDILLSSDTITVTGEESLVKSVAKAVIEPVFDGVMTETTEVQGTVSLYNASGNKIENPNLEYRADNYTVTIPVYRVKTLPLDVSIIYPDNFNDKSLSYTILPNEITIAAPANDASIENLEKIDVGEINLSNITSKDLQGINLAISLPDGYKNMSNIGRAQVTFENIDSYGNLEFTVSTENFTILNGDSNYDYTFVTNNINVTAIGPSDVLHNLSHDDIIGTVNLLGVQAEESVKTYTVTMRIAGQKVRAWITGEYKVDIRISAKPTDADDS